MTSPAITRDDYFTGPPRRRRDLIYRSDLTPAIEAQAAITVERVNALLARMAAAGVPLEPSPATGSLSHSGWRPPAINAATPNVAPKSKHMIGAACDLYDPEGSLDAWCMANLDALEAIGLWLEHPASTKGWCHVQSLPPGSGARVFYP